MYERFIEELKLYSRAIRVLSKGYLPISLLPPSKLEKILSEVRIAIAKSNKDYDLVLTRLYLYYDMKYWTTQEQILPILLETFEISPNLINAPKTL